jgi:threonine dehydratase
LAAGRPVEVPYAASFVDGAGAKAVLPGMWERARGLVREAHAVSLAETAAAVRALATRAHVVAEGAGALAVAVALGGAVEAERVVCIVSGGNIDPERLAEILVGQTPD